MAKHQFQTEINQLLHLMIHSLYSDKEIFLRELISNASDAMDKLQYLTLTDDGYKSLYFQPKITITFDKEAKSLSIADTGIGMNEDDLVDHLGTIAKSGTKSFVENLTGDAKKDSSLIGQFGVGFYSAFMVAQRVEVVSKKALDDQGYKWISTGDGSYEIEACEKEGFGTTITLFLTEEGEEFASSWKIKNIVEKYSNFIPFPIFLVEDDKEEQINQASALWRRSKSEITQAEYDEFYKTLSHDNHEPLVHLHTKAEGSLEYTTLFYIPKTAPMDMFRVDYQPGLRLYVKRVFINDDDKELMPTYLRFLRGVIDVEDLPLNVSREILQQNKILANVKQASTKKILTELEKIAKKDQEKYLEFYRQYGRVLKEGLYSDYMNKETILELIRFKSTQDASLVSLAAYKERMKEDQKAIYYILGSNEKTLKNSPLLENFKAQGIEVLILDDEIDEIVFSGVTDYQQIPIKAVNRKDSEDLNTIDEATQARYAALLATMKTSLENEVSDVTLSTRLTLSPSCIIASENAMSEQMKAMFKQMGGGLDLPDEKPILELNPAHDMVTKLLEVEDETLKADMYHILLDQAKLLDGKVIDTVEFTQRLNRLVMRGL